MKGRRFQMEGGECLVGHRYLERIRGGISLAIDGQPCGGLAMGIALHEGFVGGERPAPPGAADDIEQPVSGGWPRGFTPRLSQNRP